MASAITAKWSTPGLLTYGNRPANPSTDLNREWKPILNDPRERSGLTKEAREVVKLCPKLALWLEQVSKA